MNENGAVWMRLAFCTVIAVFLFALPAHSFTSVFHPICPFVDGKEGAIDHIEDISQLLHGSGSIPTSTCIFNPTVLHYKEDIFLWAARSYAPKNEKLYCITSLKDQLPSLSFDRRQGKNTFILAATKTIYHGKGNVSHELLGLSKIAVHLEDPRLFQDGQGTVWLLTHNPREGSMVVASVGVKCGTEASGKLKCNLELSDRRLLNFAKRMRREKNWVPHNGTTKMSYPVYPTFGPHKVFAWRSYSRPVTKDSFDWVAPVEPFFEQVHKRYGDLLHFAGSSPAILYDDAGTSYVAVGHIRAHPACFHDPHNASVGATCGELAAKGVHVPRRGYYEYRYQDGRPYKHHELEYAMFLYRFSAQPPYQFTHVSHALEPCAFFHTGIMYPSGLTRIGPGRDFLISFGEADRYSRLMVMSAAQVDRLLVPIQEMRGRVMEYSLCTLPPCMGAAA